MCCYVDENCGDWLLWYKTMGFLLRGKGEVGGDWMVSVVENTRGNGNEVFVIIIRNCTMMIFLSKENSGI